MERRTRTTGRSKGLLRRAGLGLEASPLAQGLQAVVPGCAALPRRLRCAFRLQFEDGQYSPRHIFVCLVRRRSRRFALAALLAGDATPGAAEDKERGPCIEDAMLVFDASGSMAGNLNQGIATTIPTDQRGAVGARQGAAEHHPLPPRRAHHLRAGAVSAMQRPARSQAHARRRAAHHAGGERVEPRLERRRWRPRSSRRPRCSIIRRSPDLSSC